MRSCLSEQVERILAQPIDWMRRDGWVRLENGVWRTPDDREADFDEVVDHALSLCEQASTLPRTDWPVLEPPQSEAA